MAVVNASGTSGPPNTANLSTAQTGNGASTNVAHRGGAIMSSLVQITTTVGAGPTCTYALEGSNDNTNWFAVPYADVATPATFVLTTFVITTAVTVFKIIQSNIPVRYLRITYSANTNVTSTADLWAYQT